MKRNYYYAILIATLLVFLVGLFFILLSTNNINSPNNTISPNCKTCNGPEGGLRSGWQPIGTSVNGNFDITFPYGYELINDPSNNMNRCCCRPGLSIEVGKDSLSYCLDKDGVVAPSQYYATNPKPDTNNIYGLDNAKIGDDCFTDTDCGQIYIDSTLPNIKYLSNLRCNADPSKTIKGKCEDISTLYGINDSRSLI